MTLRQLNLALVSCMALASAGCDDSNSSNSIDSVLIERSLGSSVTQQTIDAAMTQSGVATLTGPASCDVDLHEITYQSLGVDGEAVVLSAAVSIPAGEGCEGPFPILAKGHGTRTLTTHSEANLNNALMDHGFFASQGYIVVSPDYLGLGKSDYSYHPYLHRDSQAQSMIDAIRGARNLIKALQGEGQDIPLSDKVMLMGYSQGGHTAMATQRAIEANHLDEFNLVATAPMAGPYLLEETFLEGASPQIANIASGTLVAYIIQSYQNVYGDLYGNLNEVFLAPFVDVVASKFPGDTGVFNLILGGVFPGTSDQFLQADYLNDFLENSDNTFRARIRENEVLENFVPTTPMVLCGSSLDGTVPFFNTTNAQEILAQRGVEVPVVDVASFVQVPVDDDLGLTHHLQGNPLCMAAMKAQLFDTVK